MSLIDARNASYSADDIERGLTALAVAGDNSLRAAELVPYSSSTLRNWRLKHADRYQEIRLERAPQIEQTIVQEARAFALSAGEVERQALQAVLKSIENGTCKDPASALRNVTTSKALQIDKVLQLEGRPSRITVTVTADEALTWAESQGWLTHVDSTAEEIEA
jgi:hypothetical protein